MSNQRKVTVYSTQGKQAVSFDTDAEKWSQITQKIVDEFSIVDLKKVKIIIGASKLTLESPDAVLPENDFTLFILPKSTKAGVDYSSMSYKQLKTQIKAILAVTPTAKSYFTDGSKNWTQLSTDKMRQLLADYSGEEPVTAEIPEEDTNVADVVESVKKSKPTKKVKVEIINIDEMTDLLDAVDYDWSDDLILDDFNEEEKVALSNAFYSVKKVIESANNRKKLEEEQTKSEINVDTSELDDLAKDLAKGFDDVRF